MEIFKFGFAVISLGLASLSSPAVAHHWHLNYKTSETIKVSGTITETHMKNPHVWLFVDVKPQTDSTQTGPTLADSTQTDWQQTNNWAIEAGGLSSFKRKGWDRLRAGDNVTVTCEPTYDDSNGCYLIDLTVNSASEASNESSGESSGE